MSKFIYNSGNYAIKKKGRGVIHTYLTKSQAKALYELMFLKALEIESISPISSQHI